MTKTLCLLLLALCLGCPAEQHVFDAAQDGPAMDWQTIEVPVDDEGQPLFVPWQWCSPYVNALNNCLEFWRECQGGYE